MKSAPVYKSKGSWQNVAKDSGYPNLAYAFDTVKRLVSGVFPELGKVGLYIGCPHSLMKHSHHQIKNSDKSGKNWRAFMHTNHFPSTICVHPHAETELRLRNLMGMFLHEFGHQIADIEKIPNTQEAADRMVKKYFGIDIKYEGPGRVQTVISGRPPGPTDLAGYMV